jgi:hypothetical protein
MTLQGHNSASPPTGQAVRVRSARRLVALRPWRRAAGHVLAAVGPASVALNGVPVLLLFVWIVAAGIVLARGSAASRGTHRVSRERRAAHGP